jgi:hypothetical protein
VHILGLRWHDDVYLSFIPEVVPLALLQSGEDMVLLDDGEIIVLALVCRRSRLMLAVLLTSAGCLGGGPGNWRARCSSSLMKLH